MDVQRLIDGFRSARLAMALPVVVAVATAACAPDDAAPVDTRTGAVSAPGATGSGKLDLLFMIDNAPGMAPMQAKLYDQIPSMMQTLAALPAGIPDLHVAVVSSDMGAPGNQPGLTGCSQTGDQGTLQAQPRGTCSDSGLVASARFISNTPGEVNYTRGADIAQVVQCILPLGESGCQFVNPLAAVARALGADGASAPAANDGFLRPDAMLAIIMLAHEDDCSPISPVTALYSQNTGPDAQHPALGPLTTFRCNQWGHLCLDPTGSNPAAFIVPPETTPPDAQGTSSAPTLDLLDCQSNEQGLLMPVKTFVDGIRALKPDPDNQIVVGAITAPAAPYTVAWTPPGAPDAGAGDLWAQVEHSCGGAGTAGTNPEATQRPTDGSFGDPGVRLAQFVTAFAPNSATASVCDGSYASIMQPLVALIAANISYTPVASDGGAGVFGGDGGGFALDGGGPPADGGAHHPDGGVSLTRGPGPSGLQPGCNLCSVGASPTSGWGLTLLLLVPAIGRRRSRGARKKLT